MGGLFRSASGGAVGGKSSLNTAGSIAYVASAGVLGQDTSFTRSAAGRYTLYDATPTTGVTTLTVRAGAGQSSTNLQEWKNVSAVTLASISALGAFNGAQVIVSNKHNINTASLALASDVPLTFQDGTSIFAGTPDLGLARDAAGRLRVSNGSTGLGQIMIGSSTPSSASATGAAGTITWDATYIYICTAANAWRRVAHATW